MPASAPGYGKRKDEAWSAGTAVPSLLLRMAMALARGSGLDGYGFPLREYIEVRRTWRALSYPIRSRFLIVRMDGTLTGADFLGELRCRPYLV